MRRNERGRYGTPWDAVFLCFILMVFIIGCAATGGVSEAVASEGELKIIPAKLPGLNARAVPAGRYVFENSEEWEKFWEKYGQGPAPEFDFEKCVLSSVFLGQKPNPGYSVEIVRAIAHKYETIVDVVEYEPPPGMMYAQVIVYPFDAALIPRTGKPIRFSISKKTGRPQRVP